MDVAQRDGLVAAARHWLAQMEQNGNLNAPTSSKERGGRGLVAGNATLREAIRMRAQAIGQFAERRLDARRGFPTTSPVLYPFSGLDVLTALHLFPHASSYTLIADLQLGDKWNTSAREPLSCFRREYCIRMVSRSTYKLAQNWMGHHLAWYQTQRMQLLFTRI